MSKTDALAEVMARLSESDFNPHTSPWPHKVCMMVHAAQGIIDNGGFEYFFESHFDGAPEMEDFPRAFDAVGAKNSAAAIREALSRSLIPEADYSDLNDILWRASDENYEMLEKYVRANPEAFS